MLQLAETLPSFRWIDSGVYTNTPIEPIVIDEALATAMGEPNSLPIFHLWICHHALYLGRRDARLPHLTEALKQTSNQGYGAVLRSSGGACVPLDPGVLNIAILIPNANVSIDSYFQLASTILEKSLAPYGVIEIGEVVGSYCVGDYDFAINKKKIGGMAQRRTKHGSILQLCINVEGSGLERGKLMDSFYQTAGLQEMEQLRPIPSIDPTTIGSLSDVSGRPVCMQDVKEQLYTALSSMWKVDKDTLSLAQEQLNTAGSHLLERLSLFSFTAWEIQKKGWKLP